MPARGAYVGVIDREADASDDAKLNSPPFRTFFYIPRQKDDAFQIVDVLQLIASTVMHLQG